MKLFIENYVLPAIVVIICIGAMCLFGSQCVDFLGKELMWINYLCLAGLIAYTSFLTFFVIRMVDYYCEERELREEAEAKFKELYKEL